MLIFKDDSTIPNVIPEINNMADEFVCLAEAEGSRINLSNDFEC